MLKQAFRAFKGLTPIPVQGTVARGYQALLRRLPLEMGLKVRYFQSYQRLPDLKNPKLFSEKCQAVKLASPDLSRYVDKVAVKEFVRDQISDKYVIPTLYSGAELPPKEARNWTPPYVIKTNHGSGGNIFIGNEPDWEAVEARLSPMMNCDFGAVSGETFYSSYPRQVLIEPFISENAELPLDYKIFTCNGMPQFIQVDTDRGSAHKRVFFDLEWNRLPIRFGYPDDPRPIPRPNKLSEMIKLASTLAQGFGFVRVDFYEVASELYFGEMTFTPESGLMKFEPASIDAELGEKWPWP